MSDDYKYKNLPRAANGIAPAYWDEEEKQWLPYEGGADMVKELNDIKATQAKILERLDEPLDTNTQVIGSNVEKEILYERGIYTKNKSKYYLDPPERTRYGVFYMRVFGATGTFEENGGISILIRPTFEKEVLENIRTKKISEIGMSTITIGEIGEQKQKNEYNKLHGTLIPIKPHATIEFYGVTFEEGEGVELELGVYWIKGW